MMNKVILIGRLTKDPEIRYTPGNNIAVTTFTLAVDRPYVNQNGKRDADFIKIVAWRKLAEICANNLTKGRLTGVEGRLQTRSYEGQDGQRRYITEVVAETVLFLDKPKNGTASEDLNQADPTDDPFDIDFSFDVQGGEGDPF